MTARTSFGQRAAERMQRLIGSWKFLIGQSLFLAAWLALNSLGIARHWDGYPYILCNLLLSFQAAFTGPILMIASNRTEAHQREIADLTFADAELDKAELARNSETTEAIHALTRAIHAHLLG